jgi:hypothetical protein
LSAIEKPIQVQVTDEEGDPLEGIEASFTGRDGCASQKSYPG